MLVTRTSYGANGRQLARLLPVFLFFVLICIDLSTHLSIHLWRRMGAGTLLLLRPQLLPQSTLPLYNSPMRRSVLVSAEEGSVYHWYLSSFWFSIAGRDERSLFIRESCF